MSGKGPDSMGRRAFWGQFLGRLAVGLDELKGRPQLALTDLSHSSDRELGGLMPKVTPGVEIDVGGEVVVARKQDGAEVPLFPLSDQLQQGAFNSFNGLHTMDQAATMLADSQGVPLQEAFSCLKELFLRLVVQGVCLPANPIPPLESDE